MKRAWILGGLAAVLLGLPIGAATPPPSVPATAAATAAPPTERFVVEFYYRFRWGFEEEFLDLYWKNHMPFVRRMLEKGSLVEVRMEKPREHMPETERWDLRTTFVYRDAAAAIALGEIDEKDYVAIVGEGEAEAEFKRAEQRRFELLLAHWDVNIGPIASFTPDDLPEQTKAGGR
jgi:hypothetical protein